MSDRLLLDNPPRGNSPEGQKSTIILNLGQGKGVEVFNPRQTFWIRLGKCKSLKVVYVGTDPRYANQGIKYLKCISSASWQL